MFGFKKRRRKRLRAQPFPEEWLAVLRRNIPYYRVLSPADREELHGHIQVFLAEKRFEGLGGLNLTDEIRVTVAGQACILLLHRDTDYYPSLLSILVYPSSFVVPTSERLDDGTVLEGAEERLGESWHRGEVVLSWDDARHGAADLYDGLNVVFHEFAHQLDDEGGVHDGVPKLANRSRYLAWGRVFIYEYQEMLRAVARRRRTFLDQYAATNPAEFFAVAVETFFEKPIQLKRRHPEMYAQLADYFKQDPVARFRPEDVPEADGCPDE